MRIVQLIKEHKVFAIIILLSFISALRSLIMPLIADETTYYSIASNILDGRYYQKTNPSTVSPIIPFILAFFKTSVTPIIGITLHKLFHILLAILGFRYLHLFLSTLKLNTTIVLAIVALCVVNPIGITFYGRLYPESILLFCFWGFMYYSVSERTSSNFIKMIAFFLVLTMTRYLYAVLGVIVLYNCYQYYKISSKQKVFKLATYCVMLSIPILFWGKYVYNIEQSNLSEVSYFDRYKSDSPLLYNIKAGLGIIKHHEVNRINGILAFSSLFVPIDGFRNFILSIGLILAFVIGYFRKNKPLGAKLLIIVISLAMLGLIFAGTGFSRYWLILLPGFILGYYYLASRFNLPDKWFVYASYALCFVYILNEFRLDYLIMNKYL
ncbi:hypothetical protein [Winogradskyella sp.]|uniref:hypothetical protein n=1 Tax=Winogradskyella sp. TaxID=1883156 RepID=UPI0025FBA420|nr:hypothetical protein [Winogradskyella sp.]